MRRHLPPFPALRAFEAAARLGSFRAAADELCVTPSAISHQVRKLEEHLVTSLYDRDRYGPVLNDQGQAYLDRISPIMDELEACTTDLFASEDDAEDVLSIQATPSFLSRWLIPRLSSLRQATGLELRLTAGLPPTDFSSGDVDAIIHWGAEPVDGAVIVPFLQTPKVVVASPDLLIRLGRPEAPADLVRFPLLRDEVDDCWPEWLAGAGVIDVDPNEHAFPAFAHCELALTAAERGQGIALAYEALVPDDLADGRLVQLFAHKTTDKLIYSLAYPDSSRRNHRIRAFQNWLIKETEFSGGMAETV